MINIILHFYDSEPQKNIYIMFKHYQKNNDKVYLKNEGNNQLLGANSPLVALCYSKLGN